VALYRAFFFWRNRHGLVVGHPVTR
jgi:hypothetical protein